MQDNSLSIAKPSESLLSQKIGATLIAAAILCSIIASSGQGETQPELFFWLIISLVFSGGIIFSIPYYKAIPGIKNNGIMQSPATNRGAIAWGIAILMTGFYIILYWFPYYLDGLIRIMDPISMILRNKVSDQWFLYGTFYTLAVLIMGIRFIGKYRHSRYQILRTFSVMFFQLGFAFLIPAFLLKLNQPEFYFSYFWPLKYSYLFPNDIDYLIKSGNIGVFMVFWGLVMTFIATPILTYNYGKRWYCSWICGCGALAETLGDPYRQNSDKSLKAWKVERWMVHSVLVFVTLTTALLWLNSWKSGTILGDASGLFSQWYGFMIGSVFSGVIGTGFYPIMGSRVWCRFGCPMAAILGLFQRFKSKFRITTNGGQCISCGNCSTYCEMGIDVRAYAQKGENIIRASCVGCGICSAVCPRGVLKLENMEEEGRFEPYNRHEI
ncbi:4Fe-4S binding domain-containing protein [Daejeonella rubra]|uniref:4Fe-4S binding domain-containing protein n=1 Tax=Daejeonella rubra TaxID=990371 RepID=A0A1G9N5P1_9SPHI|nr:4Fe-4S dicluster domain-containing protein [Daejeonella rubra]SDL81165.1 4Fe-4S binding domain-containing protein [Daejeonella rubra]